MANNQVEVTFDLETQKPVPVQIVRRIRDAGLLKQAQSQMVTDGDTASLANIVLTRLNTGMKLAEQKRLEITKPLRDEVTRINESVKAALDPFRTAFADLDQRLRLWRQEEQNRIAAERRRIEEKARKEQERRQKIQEAHAAKGHEVHEITPVQVELPVSTELQKDTSRVRQEWRIQVTDEDKVPRAYCSPDERKLNDALRTAVREMEKADTRPALEIEGCEVYQKEIGIYA